MTKFQHASEMARMTAELAEMRDSANLAAAAAEYQAAADEFEKSAVYRRTIGGKAAAARHHRIGVRLLRRAHEML